MCKTLKHISRLLAILVLGLLTNSLNAQQTIVVGKVFETETNEPIPFANVFFKDSKIGSTTDEKGAYRIETYYPTDSLLVTVLGYQRGAQKVKADRSQVVDFEMKISGISLGPVTVIADKKAKDPAVEIMKKVIRNKKANNREKLEAYEYNVYNKITRSAGTSH